MEIIVKLKILIMENLLVFWVVGLMIVPAVIGGVIFALKDRQAVLRVPVNANKSKYVAPMWPEGYIYQQSGGNFDWERKSVLNKMYVKLLAVDKTDPEKRKKNKLDVWFDKHIDLFCRHSEFLAYIARYGYLTSRFIDGLRNPENNVELQKNLVSVVHNDLFNIYYPNCQNLLWEYLGRWDLCSEIKKTIEEDPRFANAKEMYERRSGKISYSK